MKRILNISALPRNKPNFVERYACLARICLGCAARSLSAILSSLQFTDWLLSLLSYLHIHQLSRHDQLT